MDALDDPALPLVATVVNTIDDALDRSDPAATEWTLDTVGPVRHLLDQAGDRVVVLLSDHGHVLDRGADSVLRSHPDATGPSRWRPAGAPARDGEVAVAGARVLLGGGSVVLPWREELRYGPRKAGYHGGASPAEVVIPLAVLTRGDDLSVPGWSAAPVAAPAWWRGPVEIPVEIPAEAGATVTAVESATGDALFDLVTGPPPAEPARATPLPGPAPTVPAPTGLGPTGFGPTGPDRAATVPPLVGVLLAAAQYKRNRQLKLASQPVLPDERVAALLAALLAAGGRLRMDALAAQARVPAQRIAGTVTVLRRLLSVEGYQSVTVDSDGQTVLLDEQMLRDQFGLGTNP
jgi:hypothetical protein